VNSAFIYDIIAFNPLVCASPRQRCALKPAGYCVIGAEMNRLTEVDKAYLAGLIDGEGCIFISKYKGKNNTTPVYSLRVVIALTDEDTINHWHRVTGAGCVHRDESRSRQRDNNSIAWQWIISQNDAVQFLQAVYDYLYMKKDQADTAFEFMRIKTDRSGRYGVVNEHITRKREALRLRLMDQKKAIKQRPDTERLQVEALPDGPQMTLF
jgi:hypothetical protein